MRSRFVVLIALSLLLLVLVHPQQQPAPPPAPSASFANPEPIQVELQRRSEGIKWRQTLLWHESLEKAQQGQAEAAVKSAPELEPAQHMAHYEPGSIEQLICSVFGETCPRAIRIATCESGLNPSAYNRSGASGLFQIMMPLHADLFADPADVFDPYANTQAAFSLSRGGTNWSAWECA